MADIAALKQMYRRLARIKTTEGTLDAQKQWLETAFTTRADAADAGGFQASSRSFEGLTFTGIWKGASDEERAQALMEALDDIDREIAAEAADEVTPTPIAALMPRVITAPR